MHVQATYNQTLTWAYVSKEAFGCGWILKDQKAGLLVNIPSQHHVTSLVAHSAG